MRYFLTLLIVCISLGVQAATPKETADQAYRQKDYIKAQQLYEECIAKASPKDARYLGDCHYNLANSYYRLKDIPLAILHYKRALYYSPTDKDAAFNLELAQTKLQDRFDAPGEMFFVTWFKSLTGSLTFAAWGLLSLAFLILFFVTGFCYYRAAGGKLRLLLLIISIVLLIGFLFGQLGAALQYYRHTHRNEAVIMRDAPVYDAPVTSAKPLRTLHPGTTVLILDSYREGWIETELPDGTAVWINRSAIQQVIPASQH